MEYKFSYKNKEHGLISLSVYNTGYQLCQSGDSWGPGIRDHYLIHYVASGSGVYSINGLEYPVSAGQIFLTYPDTTVYYQADDSIPWEYYWVGFNGSDARMLLKQTDFSKECPIIAIENGSDVKTLLLAIYSGRGTNSYEQARMVGNLYLFLSYLIENSISPVANRAEVSSGYLRSAMDYIAGNYSSNISVEDTARSVGISRSGLYRIFMKHLGVSPVAYLTDFRIGQACTLLKTSNLSIESVAYSVGYEDPMYFSRVFKQNVGFTPRQYSKLDKN